MADTTGHLYPTERLRCWDEAKKLRLDYYDDYKSAHETGGIRWAGGAWSFDAVPYGLGDDVHPLTGEPYGASIAFNKEFSVRCQEAVEKAGYARDLCSYMRNYWGSILLDEYAFGGPFPKPDFMWQDHICCSHAKWYQVAGELEGGDVPTFSVDVSVGPMTEITDNRVRYVVDQLKDGIDWLEEVTGRDYDDERLIRAVYNECYSTSRWAEICQLNKAIPAPLDEKTMYSLYVFGTLMKSSPKVRAFYDKLYDEVRDRVDRGIAAIPNERCRVMSDTQPPWAFLKVFRYLETFGTVSIGSLYTHALIGAWEVKDDGMWGPRATPQELGVELTNRDEALEYMVRWNLHKPEWQHFYDPQLKSEMMVRIAKEWKLDGVMLHYNRGCEGLSLGIAENRLAVQAAGFPVMTFEGNMGDEREFDEGRTMARIDAFMETLGMERTDQGVG